MQGFAERCLNPPVRCRKSNVWWRERVLSACTKPSSVSSAEHWQAQQGNRKELVHLGILSPQRVGLLTSRKQTQYKDFGLLLPCVDKLYDGLNSICCFFCHVFMLVCSFPDNNDLRFNILQFSILLVCTKQVLLHLLQFQNSVHEVGKKSSRQIENNSVSLEHYWCVNCTIESPPNSTSG